LNSRKKVSLDGPGKNTLVVHPPLNKKSDNLRVKKGN
jgi:hypothetical protein